MSDGGDLRTVETINVSTTPLHPLGMTPSALALSADQNQLYVVCSDANAAAVVDVTEARSHVLGFIPTGWYPTAAKALAGWPPGGAERPRLAQLSESERAQSDSPPRRGSRRRSARVCRTHSDRLGIRHSSRSPRSSSEVTPPKCWRTRRIHDGKLDSQPAGIPPIEHVIYIVKENRTYDQVLGDIGKGESDPSLCLFKENVSPNHHKLAREFVLFDNFYVNGDVSADGHNWSTSAIANDYVAEAVAQQLRRPPQALRLRRRRACRASPGRLHLDQRRRARCLHAQLRLLGHQPRRARPRWRAEWNPCAIPSSPKSRT